jgi:DNA-binding CsgD family transcriptional regulator
MNHNSRFSYLKIFDSLPAILYITDNRLKTIVWCNKMLEKESGYSFQEIKQMGIDFFKTIMHPDDFFIALKAQQQFNDGKLSFGGTCRLCGRYQQSWKWWIGVSVPFSYNEASETKEVICILQNLSLAIDTPSRTNNAISDLFQSYHINELEILTSREKQILILLKEGFKAPQIARKLFISFNTVQIHLTHLRTKLNVHSSVSLVRKAIEYGL